MAGGRAARLWTRILHQCFGERAPGQTLEMMLLKLIMRGYRNQMSNSELHHFCECFSGVGNITRELLRAGFKGSAFDSEYTADHNLLDSSGFELVLNCLTALRRHALLITDLECPRPAAGGGELLVRRDGDAFTGNKDNLVLSQVYTRSFGRAVARICRDEWGSHREPVREVQEWWKLDESSSRAKDIRKKLTGWRNSLSFQEKAKLHMARALIMNPEILILEKPLMNLDEAESERVMTVLREYVSNRGVAMSSESRDMRRLLAVGGC
ncbi:unnamed protein product [Cladocopium goreaui]|uniref:Tetratricopeptide repeat protein 30A n=1 Tax=Cladocopium goreaui TaxID=2562237 RepID=A0A9P1G0T2_9DINO|nr:unnamed protein product [Cladocopium goreaui]